jgi:hypothetical protein
MLFSGIMVDNASVNTTSSEITTFLKPPYPPTPCGDGTPSKIHPD